MEWEEGITLNRKLSMNPFYFNLKQTASLPEVSN